MSSVSKHLPLLLLSACLATPLAQAQNANRVQTPPPPPVSTHEKNNIPADVDLVHETYLPVVPPMKFPEAMRTDIKDKPGVMQRQASLLKQRYDLSNNPSNVDMSGGQKKVQQGIRVKLPQGTSWDELANMTPDQIRDKGLFPKGFLPLPHVKHKTGGQVFPVNQIDIIRNLEGRSLERFDVDFDLPDHLTPEFPPPIFLTTHPDLGDVSQGKVLSIDNYFDIMHGLLNPVQIDGLRLLLTPFPQQQFNQTGDRKTERPSLGVACLDCHTNGHTNAAFHLNPDTRPQVSRMRLDSVSLRGMFNQQIHGSKRSLRSIEDFTEFEQRIAYFDGDQITATKKGLHAPDRASQVSAMAQFQNLLDFPPAPKLDMFGRLIPAKATEQELKGEELFFGKGRCATCHVPPFYLDDKMHDLKVERFYKPQLINDHWAHGEGAIKTFTLRGIKDSPPYLHDGRLLTLEDTVVFFSLVTGVGLTEEEVSAVTAFLRTL